MASFLGWHKASLLSQTLLPFIYPSMLPHPFQDPVRMSRIKYRGSQVFIKHIAFQLVSKIKQTHLGLFKAPFLTFLHYFKGIGACAFATWHAQPNCDPFLSKPPIFLFCRYIASYPNAISCKVFALQWFKVLPLLDTESHLEEHVLLGLFTCTWPYHLIMVI